MKSEAKEQKAEVGDDLVGFIRDIKKPTQTNFTWGRFEKKCPRCGWVPILVEVRPEGRGRFRLDFEHCCKINERDYAALIELDITAPDFAIENDLQKIIEYWNRLSKKEG